MRQRFVLELSFYPDVLESAEALTRRDRVIGAILKRALRRPTEFRHHRAFVFYEDSREFMVALLKRLWAYSPLLIGGRLYEEHPHSVFGYTILPEHVYTDWECNQAEHLLMRVPWWCGEFGKSYDTRYDESRYCEKCGAGAKVIDRLIVPPRLARQVKGAMISKFSRNEVVISQEIAALLAKAGIEGFRLLPVVGPKSKLTPIEDVLHFQVERECGAIPARNLVDPKNRCPDYSRESPHRPGFWLLSPLYLRRDQLGGDLFVTRDHFEQYMGDILPGPLIVVSQKVYRILKNAGTQGVTFEPVFILDEPDDGIPCGHEFDNLEAEVAQMDLVVPHRPQPPKKGPA